MINKVITERVEKAKSFRLPSFRGKYGGQYTRGILTTLLLVLGLPMALYLIARPTLLRITAAPGNSVLSIVPPVKNVANGETGTVEVVVNPNGDNVNSVQLVMTYDPAVINVTNIRPGAFFTNESATVGQPLEIIKNISTPGQITYAVSFPISQNFHSSTAIASVAYIDFTAVGEGTSTFNFTTTGSSFTKVGDSTGANVFKNAITGDIVVGGGSRLYLDNLNPANPQTAQSEFSIDVFMDTAGKTVSGVDARLTFDPNVLRVQGVVQNSVSPFSSYPALEYNNTAGTIDISGNIGTGASASGVTGNGINVATVSFLPLSATSGTPIAFNFVSGDRNDSNIVEFSTSGSESVDILSSVSSATIVVQNATATTTPTATPVVTVTPTSTPQPPAGTSTPIVLPTPTPTITPSPTPVPTVTPSPTPVPSPIVSQTMTITISAQGRNYTGAVRIPNIVLSYRKPSLSQITNIGTLTTNTSGQVITALVPGDYIFLADAPGFLKRRYGSDNSPVQITSGNLLLNLSALPLLGGDFNNDDIVNEVDYTLNFLPNFLTNNAVVDLDGSGEVNNLDYGIMRSNWGLRSDTL